MLSRLAYMSKDITTSSNIITRITAALLGGVTPTPKLTEERIRETLQQVRPGAELQPSRADVYRPGPRVSLEEEARITHRLQREIDDAVDRENSFDEASMEKGLAPCQRVRRKIEG